MLQSIKKIASVYLIIEITPESRKSTILNFDSLDGCDEMVEPQSIFSDYEWKQFEPYFDGLESIKFAVFPSKRAASLSTYKVSKTIAKFVSQTNPNVIHFDTVSIRALALLSSIRQYPYCISIHDPKPHSGEFSWKTYLVKKFFYSKSSCFLFHSNYSLEVFRKSYRRKVPTFMVKLTPYTFYRNISEHFRVPNNYILFVGRMSKYKGIDILLKAIPSILEDYPDMQFVFAGRAENYVFPIDLSNKYIRNIQFINSYMHPAEMSFLISRSKFIVCPYRDATQSGVLMTAFALGKTAVATNVGSFPEYISHNHNGLLAEPNSFDVSEKIKKALQDEYYLKLQDKVSSTATSKCIAENIKTYQKYYKTIFKNQVLSK